MIICLLIPLSTVSASDINNTADDQVLSATPNTDTLSAGVNLEQENDTLSVNDENILQASNNDEILGASALNDLQTLIRGADENDTISLENDYIYTSGDDKNGITITKSLTIDGNKHTINCTNLNRLFTVNAPNVYIKNLNIINANVTDIIYWAGNNGNLIGTTFNNCSVMKGCVNWYGDNGIVKNVIMTNIIVDESADAANAVQWIFIHGSSTQILDSKFMDSSGGQKGLFPELSSSNTTIRNCDFINSNSSTSFSFGSAVHFQRCSGLIENCRFIGTNYTGSYGYALFANAANVKIHTCYFENNKPRNSVFRADGIIDMFNSTFINNGVTSISMGASGVIRNCTFKNSTQLQIQTEGNGVKLYNSTFDNTSRVISSSHALLVVDHCKFLNTNTTSDYNTLALGSRATLTNNIFENNIPYKNRFVVQASSCNNASNTGLVSASLGSNFTSALNIYASPNALGSGDGFSAENATTLSNALSILDYGGTIWMLDGVYTDLTNRPILNGNLRAYNDAKPIINTVSIYTGMPNGIVEGITFNNTKNSFSFAVGTNISGCSFENYTIADFYSGDNCGWASMTNCNFTNVNITASLFYSNSVSELNFTNNQFKNCDINSFICDNNFARMVGCVFDTITIDGSNISYILRPSYVNNEHEGTRKVSFLDFTIQNSNITNRLIDTALESSSCPQNINYDGVYLYNNTFDGDYLFYLCDNNHIENLNIENLTSKNDDAAIFFINATNCVVKDSVLDNLTGFNTFLDGNVSGIFDTVKFINSKDNAIGFISPENFIFNKLTFENINFTDCMGVLNKKVTVRNSVFDTFQGNLRINDDFVTVENSIFTNGLNNTVQGNGSCIELVNGNTTIIRNCTFNSNTAYNGGAVYIHNITNSSYIFDSTFNGNLATGFAGGALFIEPGIYYYVDEKTLATFDNIVKNNDFYHNGTLSYVNDVWVASNPGEGSHRGTYDDPTDFVSAMVSVGPYGIIHFRYENDVISFPNSYYSSNSATLVKPGLIFMGNNTLLENIQFIVDPTATDLSVYNMIFSGMHDYSVVVLNADNGRIVNCTFKDNGGENITYGGAILFNAYNLTIINSSFIKNSAGNNSGSYGGAIYCNGSLMTISNCTFDENSVYGSGSHIYLSENSNYVWIGNNSTFKNGIKVTSSNSGSGVFIDSTDHVTIINSTFIQNVGINGAGVILNAISSNFVIDNNIFEENTASGNGGAVAFINSVSNNVEFKGNNFTSNVASGNGGAIFTNAALNIVDSNFTSNSASGNGGAIYINGDADLENVIFTGNSAVEGSAFYINDDKTVIVKGVTLTDNVDSYHDSHASEICSIHVGEGASLNVLNNSLTLNDGQDIHYSGYWTSDVLYVSNTTSPSDGMTQDRPTTLENALQHINPNGKIILLSDYELENIITITNNQTKIVNYNDGKNRKIKGTDKYLFNPPKRIKNLSLNNYLSF